MIKCQTFKNTGYSDWDARNRNRVVFSTFRKLELSGISSPTYSIKYALAGTENYILNNRKFAVGAGRYLIVNRDNSFDPEINSERNVTGFCFHLKHCYLYDVYLHLVRPENWLIDHPLEHPCDLQFNELVSSSSENMLGKHLKFIAGKFNSDRKELMIEESEIYYQLACLLISEKIKLKKADDLQVKRSATKKEIEKRLSIVTELIEQQPEVDWDIPTLSRRCSLSPSHFFRCFKQVYGVSPHRYQIKQKLKKAADLLAAQKLSATEVSFRCGFADLPSFSKAFKKEYKITPQQFRRTT